MDFSLTGEQQHIQQFSRRFAREVISPIASTCDERGFVPQEVVDQAHQSGLMNLNIPAAMGGQGLDLLTSSLVIEELAAGCAGIMHTLESNLLMACPVVLYGTLHQQESWLRPLCAQPRLGAFALTEPNHGSDISQLETRAIPKGDTYLLNGVKCFITNGGIADYYTVFAATDPAKTHHGISCFLVPGNTPGLTCGKKENKMGLRASQTAEIIFENVEIPAANLIGAEGQGFAIAMKTLDIFRVLVGSGSIGIAQSAFTKARDYAQQREQFGKPISYFQGIQFTLADMAIAIHSARLLVWHAAWLVDQGMANTKISAMAKCLAADVAMQVTTEAVQIFGGYGYMREYAVEKLMRDAKIGQIYEGTNQIQRLVIARELLEK